MLERYEGSTVEVASPTGFSVVYFPSAGSADGLPVKSLAASLTAFSKLFDSVDGILGSKKEPRVQLTYRAAHPGSVEVVLEVVELVVAAATLASPVIASYPSVIREAVVGAEGLFSIIPAIRNHGLRFLRDAPPGLEVERPNGTKVTVNAETTKILAEKEPAEFLWAAVAPVWSDECSRMDIVNGSGTRSTVDAENIEQYRPSEVAPDESATVQELSMTVVEVVFEGNASWKMRNQADGKTISCRVSDGEFLAEIEKDLRFGKGDVIDARVLITERSGGSTASPRKTYELVHIHNHRDPVGDWSQPIYSCSHTDDRRARRSR